MARYYNSSYYDYLQYFSLPIHFFLFIAVVFLFLIFTWYINYESMLEDLMDNFKICLMVFPVVLLLFVHWLSSDDRERVPFYLSFPEKDSLHRVGGSPLGVAVLLVFLIFMISYRSSEHMLSAIILGHSRTYKSEISQPRIWSIVGWPQ